jgi:tRNA(fMet)-specific endonuclease VapC
MRPEDLTADSVLLDTDVFSRLGEGDPAFGGFREFTIGRFLFLSYFTVGEVLGGAEARNWGEKPLSLLESSFRAYGVLSANVAVARTYGRLWARLKAAGRPIPTNDLWIAAVALSQDPPLPLLTNDRHFDEVAAVSNLVVVRP